jgi:hypothetical protein
LCSCPRPTERISRATPDGALAASSKPRGKGLADDALARTGTEQLIAAGIGLQHAIAERIDDQHCVADHVEEAPVARLDLAQAPVILLQGLLRVDCSCCRRFAVGRTASRRDATRWTLVQGILAPLQFLVFLVSLGWS